ncbi:MAG TPA: DUF664 domain-containing protein [Acidimicrobiales bacterium]|nr:DUF664 domain-containing protein [Acidimicrobiales bacterium]
MEGLDEEDWHTSVVPSGWTPAGLVAHIGDAERHWTNVIVNHDPGHPFDEEKSAYDPNAAFVTDWLSTKVLAYYQDQTNRTDETLAVTELAAAPLGHHGGSYEPHSVRAIVLHLIEETAAHSGHLEIARELIDGSTGLGLR